jgi:hypothetical protein
MIPLTFLILVGFYNYLLDPLYTINWLWSSDQITNLPYPSPLISARVIKLFLVRVGYLKP